MVRTRVGYAGGTTVNPTYHRLGDHTEVLQVEFDPSLVSYEEMLQIFWASHSPMRPAHSRQYMAAVLCQSEEQHHAASVSREAIAAEVATEILRLDRFYVAEDYHQKYYLRQRGDLMAEFRGYDAAAFVHSRAAARLNGWVAWRGNVSASDVAAIGEIGLSPEGQGRVLAIAGRSSGGAQ